MGQDPSQIRQNIEDTRERMGETIEALSYKTDVRARIGDAVTEKRDALGSRKDQFVDRLVGKVPDPSVLKDNTQEMLNTAGDNAGHAVSVAQSNPMGLAIGAAAVGFLLGMLVPSTSMENEKLGPAADQLKSRAADTAQQALEHGKQVAQETVQSAVHTAKESAGQHGQELQATVSDTGGSSINSQFSSGPRETGPQ